MVFSYLQNIFGLNKKDISNSYVDKKQKGWHTRLLAKTLLLLFLGNTEYSLDFFIWRQLMLHLLFQHAMN